MSCKNFCKRQNVLTICTAAFDLKGTPYEDTAQEKSKDLALNPKKRDEKNIHYTLNCSTRTPRKL